MLVADDLYMFKSEKVNIKELIRAYNSVLFTVRNHKIRLPKEPVFHYPLAVTKGNQVVDEWVEMTNEITANQFTKRLEDPSVTKLLKREQ